MLKLKKYKYFIKEIVLRDKSHTAFFLNSLYAEAVAAHGQAVPATKEVYKRQFDLTWPCAVESVLVSLIGSIDTMMVGGIGPEAIAAVGITNQPKFILLAVIFSLNVGVTAVVARRKGQQDMLGANSCLRQAMMISLGLSALMSVVGAVFARRSAFAGAAQTSSTTRPFTFRF